MFRHKTLSINQLTTINTQKDKEKNNLTFQSLTENQQVQGNIYLYNNFSLDLILDPYCTVSYIFFK